MPATITLDELHDVLQVALGWTNSHLHQFQTESAVYSPPLEDWDFDEDVVDERGVALSSLAPPSRYLYDFGDGWEHDVEVLGLGDEQPGCVAGEGSCPPEDCGGPAGYAELLEALADSKHPDHAEMREWVGDRLRRFDRQEAGRRVRDAVGQVPESVRLLLELAADGIKLTPRGRLPRTVVRAVQERRPAWSFLDHPASMEEDLLPLVELHGLLRHLRLLRLTKGVLRPTAAARDDLAVVRRIRSWFASDEFQRSWPNVRLPCSSHTGRQSRTSWRCASSGCSVPAGAAEPSRSRPETSATRSTSSRTSCRRWISLNRPGRTG